MINHGLAPFVKTNSGHHYSIDRNELLKYYRDLPLDVWNISSPSRLVSWEVLRERHRITDVEGVPCDLFVWGTGAPPDRRLTRVGGVPWLPKSIPWPTIHGKVLSFLCQFDFRDSFDIVGELPGDLLLIFVADEDAFFCADAERMRFIWVSANDVDVIEFADVPAPADPFEHVCAWGVRFRTVDAPNCWDLAHKASESDGSVAGVSSLPVLWGTKIGGVPYDSQQNFDSVPKNYLCQLVSIQPSPETLWPWVDHEPSLTMDFGQGGIHSAKSNLMIGDMGEITFFLQPDGSITMQSSCA